MQNKNAILFGNGLNRVGGECPSWENLLVKLAPKMEGMPSDSNTLNYECIYLNICNTKGYYSKDSILEEFELKSKIATICGGLTINPFYERMANLPVDTFMTTNYDGVLDRTLLQQGYKIDSAQSCRTETLYSIRRCHAYYYPNEQITKKVFPIHGECSAPKSIMIGYDQYCGSLGKLNDFLKGNYTYKNNEQIVKLPKITDRLQGKCKDVETNTLGRYWPDCFFTHDVHMIGIGLPLVESDLWWVLNKRSRLKRQLSEINNEIHFYGEPDDSIVRLLKAFDVKIVPIKVKEPKNKQCWIDAYNRISIELERKLNKK